MKKYLILLVIPFVLMYSCMKDTSAYLPQEKEKVNVDKPVENPDNPTPPKPDELVPGLNLVKLKVIQNGVEVERKFKYFMPISMNSSKPISLIFEFHGNVSLGSDPLDYSISYPLNVLANKNNCIIIYPAGTANDQSIGWMDSELELPFVDAILDYFKGMKPKYDENMVYSTGQSSGAIFSFVLALERSDVFAAVAPRAGQIREIESIPNRAVPIIAFNGVEDKTVNHTSAVANMINFTEKVGGYFITDMIYNEADTLEISGYKKYLTRQWSGSKADYIMYSLIDQDHYIEINKVQNLMWDFMKSHTKDKASGTLYASIDKNNFIVEQGLSVSVTIKTVEGAIISHNAPSDWSPVIENNVLKLTAPKNYNTALNINGEFNISVSLNGETIVKKVTYKLNPPKSYYEVGDIYYNADFEPVGIIFWVNPSNKAEAKAIYKNKHEGFMKFGTHFSSISTPDLDNGKGNTDIWVSNNLSQTNPYDETNSLYMWAYNVEGKNGWYMPAINELAEIAKNVDAINAKIEMIDGTVIPKERVLSSTVPEAGKTYTGYDYRLLSIVQVNVKRGNETSYENARAVKIVKK